MITVAWSGLLASGDTIPLSGYGQLGAVGVVLVTFLWFGYRAWKREADAADSARAEVARLNRSIIEIYNPTLEKWLTEAGEQRRLIDALLAERERAAPRRRT